MKRPSYPHAAVHRIESLRHPLGMSPSQLLRLSQNTHKLYRVAKVLEKDDGSKRYLYDVKQPLKHVMQRINSCFLSKVLYPDYLTGGVPGKDYTGSAAAHANAFFVIKEDITKFFPSVSRGVVYDVWRKFFKFSEEVSSLLADLTTRDGHLEQGAPTSSYLANLALWDVEPATVERLKNKGFTGYSRHVDDIVVSAENSDCLEHKKWAMNQIIGMLLKKNLKCNRDKHEILPGNEAITVLRLVANKKPSLPREEQSRIRSLVYQYCKRADEGSDPIIILQEAPKIRGQAAKLKRFHPNKGQQLLNKISEVTNKAKEKLIKDSPLSCDAIEFCLTQEIEIPPWE